MTHVSLPAPPGVMPTLVVDPYLVEDCGVQLRAACARLDDLGAFVAGPARLDDWWGESADAYRSSTASIGRGADAMSAALRRVAGRVLEHSSSLAALTARHDDLTRTGTLLADGIERLRRDVAAAVAEGRTELVPVLQARSDAVAAHIASYEIDRERWVHDLALEEREMIVVFERVLALTSVERRFGGVPDPADRALESLPAPGAPADEVLVWWRGLGRAERTGLLVAAPGVIGNLGGIPALARHRANVVRLQRDLATLRSLRDRDRLSDDESALLRNAEAAAEACSRAAHTLDPRTGERVPARLYLYDPSGFEGDGAVAVAVGDPDTADDVSMLVPGLGTDGAGIDALTAHAVTVYGAARAMDGDASHAALAWIGYDAPDNVPLLDGFSGDALGVARETLAAQGGARLAEAVADLRAERIAPPADLTVIAHSYGSTTAGHAAHDHGLLVDDLVLLGSPGLGGDVHHLVDLGLVHDQVWVGANSRDAVADLAGNGTLDLGTLLGAGLGDDPAGDSFGATRFQAESMQRGRLDGFDAHDAYLDRDSESLYNVAAILTGHDADVRRAAPISDPWWGPPHDPEHDRTPTAPGTSLR